MRTAPSPIAVASGTPIETTIWPGTRTSRSAFRVAAMCSNGTDRITSSARRVASAFSKPATSAPGTAFAHLVRGRERALLLA